MKVHYEFGSCQHNKHGEELCGDNIIFTVAPDFLTLVLSDGLGSGVKANILATLTSKIASRLVHEGLPVETVVETVSQTLPVCNVRKLAYSTFSVARFTSDGHTHVVEFDNPHVFWVRDSRVQRVLFEGHAVEGRRIDEARFRTCLGDWLVMLSDGVVNAGIGAASDLGWGWAEIARYLETHTHPDLTAQEVAEDVAHTALDLYEGKPGDDVSVAVIKVRRHRFTTVLTGPPLNPATDEAAVCRLMSSHGTHVVCGGTTANIVSRVLGRPLTVDLSTATPDSPPMGRIEQVDLVTEGVLTLSKALEYLTRGASVKELQFRTDGASALVRHLLNSDEITFLVGPAINPAHQNPNLPRELGLKSHIANELALQLTRLGKTVRVEIL